MLIEVKDGGEDESAGGAPLQRADAPAQDSIEASKTASATATVPAPPKRVAVKASKQTTKAAATPSKRPAKPANKPVKIAIADNSAPPAPGTLTSSEVIRRTAAKPAKRDIVVNGHKAAKSTTPKPVKADVQAAKPLPRPATTKPVAAAAPLPAAAETPQPTQPTQAAPTPTQPQPAQPITVETTVAAPSMPAKPSTQPVTLPITATATVADGVKPDNEPMSIPPPTLRVPTNTAHKRSFSERLHYAWSHTRKRRIVGLLLVLFALYNAGVYVAYRDRTYPHTMVNGQFVGNLSANDLPGAISKLPLLPEKVALQYKDSRREATPATLGLRVDAEQTSRALLAKRSWLPAYNLVRAPEGNVVIGVEPKTYDKTIQQIGAQYRTKAIDARIELRNNEFRLVPQVDAQTIDAAGTQAAIVEALSEGRANAMIHLRSMSPAVTTTRLQPTWQRYEAQRKTKITLTSGGKSRDFTASQIGSWFEPDATANSFKLDPSRIPDSVVDSSLELSITPDDEAAVSSKVAEAVSNLRESRIAVTGSPIGKKAFSFCTDVRGVSPGELADFSRKAESTLNDKRSWSLGGNITYKYVKSDCDFTIWLTAADQMSSFGSICDSLWSCDVTPNVVINHDRWVKASVPWVKTFGTGKMEEYRSMAINHEVGHEMGFGHSRCAGPGQPAPVMAQQSIDLQGCVFNAWPTVQERVALKNYLHM